MARCVAIPSEETESGRQILARAPESAGCLGIAISEAVEVAAHNDDTKYALGSVLNHVLIHQSVIGLEALEQMEMAGDYPNIAIGCSGGGSNFAGCVFPFLGRKLRAGEDIRIIATEPAACPTLTRGTFAYDFGDTTHLTPLVKMFTLGSTFVPSGIHAGGLHYHGMVTMVSHLLDLGLIEATAFHPLDCFAAWVRFAHAEGIVPEPKATHAVKAAIDEALKCKERGHWPDHPLEPVGPRPFRHAGLYQLLRQHPGRRGARRRGPDEGHGRPARRRGGVGRNGGGDDEPVRFV